jgi:hypothetical protein
MTANVIDDSILRNRTGVYRDRDDAGVQLALALEPFREQDAFVRAIPSGGVPVGLTVSSRLALPFDLLIIRKIPIPGYTESGFAAVSLEGDIVLNEPLVRELGLTPEEIEQAAKPVQEELLARNRIFREDRPWPDLAGRIVYWWTTVWPPATPCWLRFASYAGVSPPKLWWPFLPPRPAQSSSWFPMWTASSAPISAAASALPWQMHTGTGTIWTDLRWWICSGLTDYWTKNRSILRLFFPVSFP